MSDATRRRRLLAFVQSLRGGRDEFGRRYGREKKARVSQLFDPRQPFGEKAAASVARKFGLPEDYFEHDVAPSAVRAVSANPQAEIERAREDEVLHLWRPLFEDQRERLLAEMRRENALALRTIEEMKRRGYAADVPEDVLPPEFTRKAQRELPMEPPTPVGKRGKK